MSIRRDIVSLLISTAVGLVLAIITIVILGVVLPGGIGGLASFFIGMGWGILANLFIHPLVEDYYDRKDVDTSD